MRNAGNDREQQAKSAATWIITLAETAIFLLVWTIYYNSRVFETHRAAGAAVSLLVYLGIYCSAATLYRACKISAYPVGETILSQLLAFGLADLVLYIEACLIANRYLSLLPGLAAAALQILAVTAWAVGAKTWFIKKIPPRRTLIIYGSDDVDEFCRKLEHKYSHLFSITETINCRLPVEEQLKKIDENETVILYETAYGIRTGLMSYLVNEKKTFYITPRISDIVIQGFDRRHLIDTPLLKYQYAKDNRRNCVSKRVLDLAVSLTGLLILSPVVLITMLAIRLEDGGDIFFKQKRYTKDWKTFEILKFRSMVMDAEKDGKARPCTAGDDRITRVGRIIRRFRIDEIPQLFNVVKGDMSIVGPRPERVEHVHAYVKELPEFAYRLRVKGGLTGYAQIYGKYNTSAYDKLRLDLLYIENQSIWMDLKMILLTIKVLFIPESTEGFSEERSRRMGEPKKAEGSAEGTGEELI